MKKFKILYIAAAALLFAACANEEDGIGNNGPVAATVKADISNNIKTRGTADNNSWTAAMPLAYMPHHLAIQQETIKSM